MKLKKTFAFTLLILLFLQPFIVHALHQQKALIFYNKACSGCTKYIDQELIPLLNELGIDEIEKKDYANEKQNRILLNEKSEEMGVPPKLQGHFTIFIDDSVILQGHVPEKIVRDLFESDEKKVFDKIVVFQDEMEAMGDKALTYKVWAFKGEVKEYPIDTPIQDYLEWFDENKEILETPASQNRIELKTFLPLLLITGLFDGLNPCAFAVLLFFVAFLFTIQRTKSDILKVGSIYILMIYLTYLGIGLGILKALVIFNSPHMMAKIGAWLVIILGLVNIKDYFWYGKWFTLKVPKFGKRTYEKWMHKATIPATIVMGFLVGLCTFPCSGGPYVAILGLLAAKASFFQGFLYLLIYNIMFVLPLIVVLLAITNRRLVGKLIRWETSKKGYIKLIMGLLMILLGIIILIWFV